MNWRNRNILIFILILISSILCANIFAQETDSTLAARSVNKGAVLNTNDVREILIDSNPQDAYVFHNDSLVGSTPLFIPSEFQNLTLKKLGYENYSFKLNNNSNTEKISLKFNGFQKEESFFENDIFKILTAGILVFGGTTAYFKLKADKNFDEYEFSGDSKFLDETRKYDLISGITFGALQINFGLLLYYFLTE